MPSHMSCCFNKCRNNSRSTQNLSFHKFPANEILCKRWIELCQNEKVMKKFQNHGPGKVSKTFRICSEHFKREDYILWTSKKKVLQKGSTPTRGQLIIIPSTTGHLDKITWTDMITEENETVANNIGGILQGTQQFDPSFPVAQEDEVVANSTLWSLQSIQNFDLSVPIPDQNNSTID